MSNESPELPPLYQPPPVPPRQVDPDLIHDLEGGRRGVKSPDKFHLRVREFVLDLFGRGARTRP